MRHLVTLVWGLWFGGLIALFLAVTTLFRFDRPAAVLVAPRIFLRFERYQLVLAAIALAATFVWRTRIVSRWISAMFWVFGIAAICAVISAAIITPRLERLRAAGESSGVAFRKLHGASMIVFTFEAVLLLIAGIILPSAIAATARRVSGTASG